MKVSNPLVALTCAAAVANAQYFSDGWKPGMPVHDVKTAAAPIPTAAYVPPTNVPASSGKKHSPFDYLLDPTLLLTTEPAVALFNSFGINITERIGGVLERQKFWDDRVALIDDSNYEDIVVKEQLTEQEEKDRVWLIIISATASTKQDSVSKFVDDVFDAAFNETMAENDLPNVRWGRMDYLNVTTLTTKWIVWQAPYLVVLTDRGQTLRFYRPQNLRMRADSLREFLKTEGWRNTPAWSSRYGPGGDREFILDFYAKWLTKFYNVLVVVPRWAFFILSGSLASLVINFLHKPTLKAQEAAKAKAAAAPATVGAADVPASPNASGAKKTAGGSVKQRKAKK